MKPKVIVYKKVDQEILDYLGEYCQLKTYDSLDTPSYLDFLKELKEAVGILGSGLKVDKELLDQAPLLKVVSNSSVGYDNLDLEVLSARGIMATNTPDVLNDTTADTIFGLLLATARRFPELDHMVKSKQWISKIEKDLFGVDVHHKKLGIIGMGNIGKKIAQRAHLGFDMEILYHNRSPKPAVEKQFKAKYCSLEELLRQSDFVCLMTPLSPETVKLMGEREFKMMKRTAIFVNGSRGATVDEKALIQALQDKTILAAGLDVFEKEPLPLDHPFLTMKNVVTLPHIGSATAETRNKMDRLAAENLVLALEGKRPIAHIN